MEFFIALFWVLFYMLPLVFSFTFWYLEANRSRVKDDDQKVAYWMCLISTIPFLNFVLSCLILGSYTPKIVNIDGKLKIVFKRRIDDE